MSAKSRELLLERYDVLMTDVVRFKDEGGTTAVNSKLWTRINDTLEQTASRLVGEVHENELDSLTHTTERIWDVIQDELLTWAEMIEKGRAEYRQKVDAYRIAEPAVSS